MEVLRQKIKYISIPSIYNIIDSLDFYELLYIDYTISQLNENGKFPVITMIQKNSKTLTFMTVYSDSYIN